MHFELSERLNTNETPENIMAFAQKQFAKIADKTRREGAKLDVRMVEASFGSINRSDTTQVTLQRVGGGYLLVSETDYRPSVWFWVFLLVLLFTYVGWLIPIVFYLYQRNSVKSAIQSAMSRIVNEFGMGQGHAMSQPVIASSADELEKLVRLRDSGVLTSEEFEFQKRRVLGI